MKYSIQPRKGNSFNASSKAVADVCKIVESEGYTPFYISFTKEQYNKVVRNLLLIREFYSLYKTLRKNDIVLIQWPLLFRNIWLFYWVVRCRSVNVNVLIHDINILRGEKKYAGWTMRFLRLAKKIVAHSQPMKDYLVTKGFDADRIEILTAFDYLTNDRITNPRIKSKTIVFAGNLAKSVFLQTLSAADLGLTINCYGKKVDNLARGLNYKCAFNSENVSVLEGSWGLVWDGDSLDACTSPMGEYQRYNSPHKLSLYIVAHLPVIIWKEAAMASYVKEHNIGICVSSLREISEKIDAMSDNDYNSMMDNIKKESDLLRHGEHLKKCLIVNKPLAGGGKSLIYILVVEPLDFDCEERRTAA